MRRAALASISGRGAEMLGWEMDALFEKDHPRHARRAKADRQRGDERQCIRNALIPRFTYIDILVHKPFIFFHAFCLL